MYSPKGILFCQPYKRPNLAAIVPACVLGVIVLGLLCVSVGLYWRHQHRLSAAAHAKVKGPPGRPAVPAESVSFWEEPAAGLESKGWPGRAMVHKAGSLGSRRASGCRGACLGLICGICERLWAKACTGAAELPGGLLTCLVHSWLPS